MGENLFQKIKQFWKRLELKENDIIFDIGKDINLYYIEVWRIWLYDKNDNLIFTVHWPDLLGEKSFVGKYNKPLKAKALQSNSVIYVLEREIFDNLDSEIKQQFLSDLVVYISSRVYKINSILSIIWKFSDKVLNLDFSDQNLKGDISSIFSIFLNDAKWLLFKRFWDDFMYIDGNIYFDEEVLSFLRNNYKTNVKIWSNYILVWAWDFIFIMFWQIIEDYYILENALIYLLSLFRFIAHGLERKKNEFIKKTIDNEY